MYRIPRQRKHSTGIQFEAIDATKSLKLIEPIVAELGYTGQISCDFLVTDDGLTSPVVPLAASCGDKSGKHAGVPHGRPSRQQR